MRWRALKPQERQQRGCQYCDNARKGWWCPFEICPYSEMDGFSNYQDFLRAIGATVPQIIKTLKEGTK